MEADPNPFPQMDLFPRLTKIRLFLGRLVSPLPQNAPLYMSEHYHAPEVSSVAEEQQLTIPGLENE